MVALRPCPSALATLHPTALFQAPVVTFNSEQLTLPNGSLLLGHREVARYPVLRVTVWVNRPKHFDEAEAFQMNRQTYRWNSNRGNRYISRVVGVDLPILFEPGQKVPAVRADYFQVIQPAVPTLCSAALTTGCRNTPKTGQNPVLWQPPSS